MNQAQWQKWIRKGNQVEESVVRQFPAVKDIDNEGDISIIYIYPEPFVQELKELHLDISYVNYTVVQSPDDQRTETVQMELTFNGRTFYLHTHANTHNAKRTLKTFQSIHAHQSISEQDTINCIYKKMKDFLYEHGAGRLEFQLYDYTHV